MNLKDLNKILVQYDFEPAVLGSRVKFLDPKTGYLDIFPVRKEDTLFATAAHGTVIFEYAPYAKNKPTVVHIKSVNINAHYLDKYKALRTELFLHGLLNVDVEADYA